MASEVIGIGITTKDRPDLLDSTLQHIMSRLPSSSKVIVSDDSVSEQGKKMVIESCARFGVRRVDNSHNRGIARNKNSCLRELRDSDYIFLFDDDCYPIKDNWAEYIIDCHNVSGVHHFNLLDANIHHRMSERVYGNFKIEEHRMVGGVFMFLTKDVVEKVGAFNKDYDVYGFEHASYTYRVFKSGLHNGLGINLTISDLQDYIFSLDYGSFPFNVNHKRFLESSMGFRPNCASSVTQEEAKKSIANNHSVMAQDIKGPVFREL